MSDIVSINGAIGGGSVIRLAVPLGLSMNKTLKIENIRANRSKPGLRLQHLLGLKLIELISGSKISGLEIGSTTIKIEPGAQKNKDSHELTINTAASISLIKQIAENYSISTSQNVEFSFKGGGTFTEWSPVFTYCENAQKPMFNKIGLDVIYEVAKHGFYPKGGAKGSVKVSNSIKQFNFSDFTTSQIHISSIASSNLKRARVAERQIEGVGKLDKLASTEAKYVECMGSGTAITAFVVSKEGFVKGFTALGNKRISAEKVGRNLRKGIDTILNEKGSVDCFMADQLLLPLAFAPPDSSYTVSHMTDHIETNLRIIDNFLPNSINIVKDENLIKFIKN